MDNIVGKWTWPQGWAQTQTYNPTLLELLMHDLGISPEHDGQKADCRDVLEEELVAAIDRSRIRLQQKFGTFGPDHNADDPFCNCMRCH